MAATDATVEPPWRAVPFFRPRQAVTRLLIGRAPDGRTRPPAGFPLGSVIRVDPWRVRLPARPRPRGGAVRGHPAGMAGLERIGFAGEGRLGRSGRGSRSPGSGTAVLARCRGDAVALQLGRSDSASSESRTSRRRSIDEFPAGLAERADREADERRQPVRVRRRSGNWSSGAVDAFRIRNASSSRAGRGGSLNWVPTGSTTTIGCGRWSPNASCGSSAHGRGWPTRTA